MWYLRKKESKEIINSFESLHSLIEYKERYSYSWDEVESVDNFDLRFEEIGMQAIYETYGIDEV